MTHAVVLEPAFVAKFIFRVRNAYLCPECAITAKRKATETKANTNKVH